jgi:serine protease Do
MSTTRSSSKLHFLLLTFLVSTVAILGMAAASGKVLSSAEPARPASQAAPSIAAAPQAATPSEQDKPKVAPAQRTDSRELPLPPRRDITAPGLMSIPDIVERCNDAVVNIRATEIIRPGSNGKHRGNSQDPFEFFFPRPDGRQPHGQQDEEDDDQRQDSGGSGFIVTEDGYVLTNYHVIEDADKVVVQLSDENKQYEATVVGTDPTTDLALLKITATRKLATITLGDSDQVRVGEWVIAIGNPLAYDHTVTVGVVSAKGRKLAGLSRDVSLDNYIQTDAAINRGNSGGPLMNLKGEAVGINSAISVAGQGISFAIPINMARDVMTQLRDKGKVSRGFLGVTIKDIQQELSPEDREYFKLEGRKGAFVNGVTRDQPAARAGVKPGDAIVSVDGQTLNGSDDLIRTISAKTPGAAVALGIIRDGKEKTLSAELMNRPDPLQRASNDNDREEAPSPGSDKRLGVTVEDITPRARQEFRIDDELSGVVITRVSQVSDAWEKGLREGDVIVEVNKQTVASVESYRAIVEKLKPGEIMALYVATPGVDVKRFVTLRVGQE